MDLTIEKQPIGMKQEFKTELQEYAIDNESVLPDYSADMSRILKCQCRPQIKTKQILSDKLQIEGTIYVWVLYVDEKGEIGVYTQTLPLYHELSIPEKTKFADVYAKTDYCNCHMISPRKMEFHGAVSLKIVLSKWQEVSVVCSVSGEGAQTLDGEEQFTSLLTIHEQTLSVNDEIQIASGGIRNILRSEATVLHAEYKGVGGKAIIKADLQITALYQNTDGKIETLREQLPITQMIDLNHADDLTDCFASFRVISLELRPRTGLDGECKTVMVAAEVGVYVKAEKTFSTPVVLDAYSLYHGVELRRLEEPISRLVQTIDQTTMCKGTCELGRDVQRIVDLWCEPLTHRTEWDGTQLTVNGQLQVMIVANDVEGAYFYGEKTMEYTVSQPISGVTGTVVAEPVVTVCSSSFVLVDSSTAEVRVELQVAAQAYDLTKPYVLCDLVPDPSAEVPKPLAPLVLYFATQGERLFDIAKRYNTTCTAIAAANDMKEQVLTEAKALLIPAV